MFNSTLELINLVASNSFLVFCFCNLIIIILLIGSSKSASGTNSDEDSTCLHSQELARGNEKGMTAQSKKSYTSSNDKNESRSFIEPCVDRNLLNFEEVGRKEEDDELRERIEAFIDKTTQAWKSEMLQKSIVIQ
ncbi:hypothetical protein AgCh_005505 [Apium graveolens]